MTTQVHLERCQEHFDPLPCARCEENDKRGYAVMMLAGRCANGSELDHGTKWHAVKPGEYQAICSAKPGRRSAGWSSYTVLNQQVTCPRCLKKLSLERGRAMNPPTPEQIAKLIARRERLTNRRDEHINYPAVDEIDARLALIPVGKRPDVDALLGRRWSSDADRREWHDAAAQQTAQAAQQKMSEFQAHLSELADPIVENMRDWRDLRGDLAL